MNCPHCNSKHLIKKGFFRKKLTRSYSQMYLCKSCNSRFSHNSFKSTYLQKKPFLNLKIYLDLCSGVSMRRIALNLNVSYGLVYRRFLWLGKLADKKYCEFLLNYNNSSPLYLDEMETIEHTKLKPLTIGLIVNEKQDILGIKSGKIPAKGYLSNISIKKYGFRDNESTQIIQELLNNIPKSILPTSIKSDGKLSYKELITKRWKKITHEVCIRKSDKKKEELYLKSEKKKFDPMFALNQRCAKLRSDIKRLVRRSWCTTKKVENLNYHLKIYACYNNKIALF